jgi:hypothetical protein
MLRLRDALQLMLAPVVEAQPRPADQVLDRARHEDLAGAGERRDPGPDRDGDPDDLPVAHLEFTVVETGRGMTSAAVDLWYPHLILPIWRKVTKADMVGYMPALADKIARSTAHATIARSRTFSGLDQPCGGPA